MITTRSRRAMRTFAAASAIIGVCLCLEAQGVIESSKDTRFQLDLHVSDKALLSMLPPGFTLNVAA